MNKLEESIIELILSKSIDGKSPQKRDFSYKEQKLILKAFGLFSNAIKAAGLSPRRLCNRNEAELIESLVDFYNKRGRSPSIKDISSCETYMRTLKCAGWSDVLKRAGLPIYIETRKSLPVEKEEIINYARSLIDADGIKSMNVLLRHPKFYGIERIKKIFGDAHSFARLVGLEFNEYGVSFDVIKEKILSIANELGRTPTYSEVARHGISDLHIRKKFGTYNNVLKKIGLVPVAEKADICELSNDELMALYKKVSKEAGYKNGCFLYKFKELSGVGGDVLASRFGSVNNLRIICGYKIEHTSKQTWDRDSVRSLLSELTKRENKRVTIDMIKAEPDAPSITTIRRYLEFPFVDEATLIFEQLKNKLYD